MRNYVLVSALLFTVLAVVQLLRLLLRWSVVVNGFVVPLWVSAVAVLIVGSMAVWGMRRLRTLRAQPAAM